MTLVYILLALTALYLFCLAGRRNHPQLSRLRAHKYAHRGLHDAQKPENSLAAFRAAKEAGYGVELDIHLLRDGSLVVFHDGNIQRLTGFDKQVEELTAETLKDYPLCGTDQTIPLFSDVLKLFEGKVPMIVEVKCVGNNCDTLCRKALELLEGYEAPFCMESFDPRAVHWLKKNRPDICRGQLSENWFQSKVKLPWILKFAMTFCISNVYNRPDFIAYRYCHRKMFGVDICRKLFGLQGVTWTLKTMDEYHTAMEEGWIPIFEDLTP